MRAGGDYVKDFADIADSSKKPEKLVDAPTPIEGVASGKDKLVDAPTPTGTRPERQDFPPSRLSRVSTMEANKENGHSEFKDVQGLGVNGVEDEMKNVTI